MARKLAAGSRSEMDSTRARTVSDSCRGNPSASTTGKTSRIMGLPQGDVLEFEWDCDLDRGGRQHHVQGTDSLIPREDVPDGDFVSSHVLPGGPAMVPSRRRN